MINQVLFATLVMVIGFILGIILGGLFVADHRKRPPRKEVKGKVILTLQNISDRFGIPLEDIYIKDVDGRLREIENYVNLRLTYGKSPYQIQQELKRILK